MNRSKRAKNGTAVVELAVCLPVIFLFLFASIEACNMIALKQIISESAYDGALHAIRSDGDEPDIIAAINTVLAARNVTPSKVSIEGTGGVPYDTLGPGDLVTVTVEAETDANVAVPQLFGMAKTLSSNATAIRQ